MIILHTSDLHICSPLTSRLDAKRAATRRHELLFTFRRLADEAHLRGAEAIIIAGDLFDSERISESARCSIYDTIERAKDIVFYYLPGNHEGNAFFRSDIPENLKVFDSKGWSYFRHGDVTLAGKTQNGTGMFDDITLPKDGKSIAVLHGELRQSGDGAILQREAVGRGLDYIALGHYHTYSKTVIDERCLAVYCGAPEGRGFDEAGELGYVLIDTDTAPVSHKFIPFAKRRLFEIAVDIRGASRTYELEELIRKSTLTATPDDLVRIVLTGERELDFKPDLYAIEESFARYFWYFEIKDELKLKISADSFRYDTSLKGEFIRLVLSADDIDDREKMKIIDCGIRALLCEAFDE